MPEPRLRSSTRRLRLPVLVGLVSLALGGCHLPGTSRPTPTPTPAVTVMSTDPIRVADPAAVTDAGSAVLSLNVFQRLMSAAPGEDALKPDAARDCVFTSSTTLTCTLNKKLFFTNGHPVTSADVKFSIERAARLNVPGSSAALLSSLRRIETPDPMTVRFLLSRVDTQFGWALASPSASIVDRTVYDADELRTLSQPVVGSGPFSVVSLDDRELRLARNTTYVGRNPGRSNTIVYRTMPDSAAIEQAMGAGQVDVVWRGLNAAAITRLTGQASQGSESRTANGYELRTLTGLRVHQLEWSTSASQRANTPLRRAITAALQEDRTLDSVVPGGVPGHATSFRVGGRGKPAVSWSNRVQLDLGYDPTAPDGRDLATQIRTRLEDTGGLSVRLRPATSGAELQLVDRKAWTATALAWLQPYVDAPLPASRPAVTRLESSYLASTSATGANAAVVALQRQAAADGLVIPVSQTDEYLFVRAGVDVDEDSFGPGWQLGLFGMKNG